MKTFNYVITDEVGIHARPAGMLVKEAKNFESSVMIKKGEKKADAKKLMILMGLGVKCGEEITLRTDGDQEDTAMETLSKFLETNL